MQTGIPKPSAIGTKQIIKHNMEELPFNEIGLRGLDCRVVSTNFCREREIISNANNDMINTNDRDAICAAVVRLFMPSQTLNMPNVNVSIEKYSTVPKSDIVSMNTNAIPANIAGLANGKPIFQNRFLRETMPTSYKEAGVNKNATRDIT